MENEEIASAFLAVGKSLAVEKRYQEALEKYEQGISVYLEIYKMKDNSPDRQKYLFGIIDKNLSIAEDLKKIIKSNQVSGSVDASPRATSSNAPPLVQKSVSATVAAPRAGSVPDHHNYHVATKKSTPTSSSPRANIAANFGFSKARTSPIRSKEKKVETVSSAKSNEYENQIIEEMLDHSPGVHWSDIAGLAFAKQTLLEAVVLPNLRPDLFVGLRSPPRGVLLFGPPGNLFCCFLRSRIIKEIFFLKKNVQCRILLPFQEREKRCWPRLLLLNLDSLFSQYPLLQLLASI